MKNLKLLILFCAILIILNISAAITLDDYWFCRDIDPKEINPEDASQPINCVEETKSYLTTDQQVIILTKLSGLKEGDEIIFNIKDPDGAVIKEETVTAGGNADVIYDYQEVMIAAQNLKAGEYPIKLYINEEEKMSDSFTISEDKPPTCAEAELYCCPEGRICTSPEEVACESGSCCSSEEQCVQVPAGSLTRTLITNCEETGISNCGKVIRLYNYSIHGSITPEQQAVIYFRMEDVDCYNKNDTAIAYYDEENNKWVEKKTIIEKISEGGVYSAKAYINKLGYIALVRTDSCVPLLCTYGGYRTSPVGGYVNEGEPITLELCGVVSGCEAIKNKVCDKNCPEGIDLDCPTCTAEKDDCCLVSYDNKCDKDCASYVDPDCCRKSDRRCCPGGEAYSDSADCDKNCDTSDLACTRCTPQAGDCCDATSDGTCDPDCPKLSNGVGYLDVDCCAANGVSVTSAAGDCCYAGGDGACDCDCIIGVDSDCLNSPSCCGNQICSSGESPSSCPSDCSCGDGICSPGTSGNDENCSNCQVDCGECPPPEPPTGGW